MVQILGVILDITKDKKVVDMQVSTADDLPDLNENVEGIMIAAGSNAQVIQSGAFYTLDYNGTWYPFGGTQSAETE
jgi:hypothetical protein